MASLVPYDQFVANVNAADLAMMLEFTIGKRVIALTPAEADALFVQVNRLFDAGILWRAVRGYEDKNGVMEYQFDAYVRPEAAAYVTRLAAERIKLSRAPIPA